MRCLHGLLAVIAVSAGTSSLGFASNPDRLDKVGELDSPLERQHQARLRIYRILTSSLSNTRKIELLGEFLHCGDNCSTVQKVIGRPTGLTPAGPAAPKKCWQAYFAHYECDLAVYYHEDKAFAFFIGPRTGWLLPEKSP